jgi:D-alanyl-D-alanine carboxypeptidase
MSGNNSITITQSMLDTYGDAGHLVLGEKFTVDELIFPLLLESSNDAAEALAQAYDHKKFIQTMNSLAEELGMMNTSFKDASGLSPSNISNVKDLFVLATYYYNNEKNLLEITKMKEVALATTTDHGYHKFININPFVVYQPFIGGKTGRTQEAKESMISLFNMKVAENTYPIAVIILRSNIGDREMDTERILDRASKVIK